MLDEHGYPTKKALKKIKKWSDKDMLGLMEFVKKLWYYPDWGWHEENEDDRVRYLIDTGGWSGNEDVIDAMCSNLMFWAFCWVQSRRGGHYIFEVKHGR